MSRVLKDLASVIRSKNAGPTILTLDVLFIDRASFETGKRMLTPAAVAGRYGMPSDGVSVIPYPPALAVKITMPRARTAGAPGDRDVYGAQQHAPLLDMPL